MFLCHQRNSLLLVIPAVVKPAVASNRERLLLDLGRTRRLVFDPLRTRRSRACRFALFTVVLPLAVRAGVAHRAAAFQLAVRAGAARRAAVFQLAVRAGVAYCAAVLHLAVRAGVAVCTVEFHLPVGAGAAFCAPAFQLAVGAGVAVFAGVFQLPVSDSESVAPLGAARLHRHWSTCDAR